MRLNVAQVERLTITGTNDLLAPSPPTLGYAAALSVYHEAKCWAHPPESCQSLAMSRMPSPAMHQPQSEEAH